MTTPMTREQMIATLQDVAGGLNDGHARWPIPEIGSVIEALQAEPDKPFIWIKVEGGIADFGGDTDRVEVEQVDFDTEGYEPETLGTMIGAARRIPDHLALLPRSDPRWLDRNGIIETLTDDLIQLEYGICDDCTEVYELASRSDHCVEEGLCWKHCSDSDAHEKAQTDEVLALVEEVPA